MGSYSNPCKCISGYHYKPAGWNNYRCSEAGTQPAGSSEHAYCRTAEESVAGNGLRYQANGKTSYSNPCKCISGYHYKPAGWNNYRCSEAGTQPAGSSEHAYCRTAEQRTLTKINQALKKALKASLN